MKTLTFRTDTGETIEAEIRSLIVAGWTGRNIDAVQHHIDELAEIGVAPPSTVPLYYRASPDCATQGSVITVVGDQSSGEVEPVLIDTGEGLFLGLGSDHTDRALEAHSVALSKQICAKPVAPVLWRFDELADRVDRIELRSWIRDGDAGEWVPYQEGTLASIRPLAELLAKAPGAAGEGRLAPGTAMMCGTFPVLTGGVRPAARFRMEMRDPDTGRTIAHEYAVEALPLIA